MAMTNLVLKMMLIEFNVSVEKLQCYHNYIVLTQSCTKRKFFRQITMFSFFINHFVFRRQSAEFFFSIKVHQISAVYM